MTEPADREGVLTDPRAKITHMTLTEFLLARIHDDECLARMAFADHNGNGPDWSEPWSGAVDMGGDEHELLLCNDSGVSRHIENFDPARVLAECEAKRLAIDAAWSDHCRIEGEWGSGKGTEQMSAEGDYPAVVEALALPYADHQDYRQEWRP